MKKTENVSNMTEWEDFKHQQFISMNLTENDYCKGYSVKLVFSRLQSSTIFGHNTRFGVRIRSCYQSSFGHLYSVILTSLQNTDHQMSSKSRSNGDKSPNLAAQNQQIWVCKKCDQVLRKKIRQISVKISPNKLIFPTNKMSISKLVH